MRLIFLLGLVFGNVTKKKWNNQWKEAQAQTTTDIQSITESMIAYSISRYANPGFRKSAGKIEVGAEVYYEITFEDTYVVVDGEERDPDDVFLYIVSSCNAGERIIFQVTKR